MPESVITDSSIVEDRLQRDGRRSVTERHVDSLGGVTTVTYLAERDEDCEAMMKVRAEQLSASIVAAEVSANVSRVVAGERPEFKLTTLADLVPAIAERFATATNGELANISRLVLTLDDATLAAILGPHFQEAKEKLAEIVLVRAAAAEDMQAAKDAALEAVK